MGLAAILGILRMARQNVLELLNRLDRADYSLWIVIGVTVGISLFIIHQLRIREN